MSNKRTENNIGESQKTSVKVHHQPGGQSNWSLGWGNEDKPKTSSKFASTQFKNTITKVNWFSGAKTKLMMNKKRKDWRRKRERRRRSSTRNCPTSTPSREPERILILMRAIKFIQA